MIDIYGIWLDNIVEHVGMLIINVDCYEIIICVWIHVITIIFFWLTISKTTTITTKFYILNKLALLVSIVVNVFLKISYEEHIKRNCPL